MKMKFGLILGTLISTTLLAQQVTNAPPPPPIETMPAPAPTVMEPPAAATTNAPAAKPAKKKATAKKTTAKKAAKKKAPAAAELKTTPLVAGPAVVTAHHVNIRTRAGLNGEVIGHLTNGEPVTVIEEIRLKHSGPEEPSAWAKINLPGGAKAWVKSSYIDSSKTVTANKLNIRGGPGESYGVLGQLQKGDTITDVETKGDWTQIAPPANAYAFVAAQYLSQEASAIAAANQTAPTLATATEPTNAASVTPTTVPEEPTVAQTTTEAPMTNTMTSAEIISNELAAANSTQTNLTETNETATPTVEAPPEPRIVEREGIVRGDTSIQSPTKFELISPDDHKLINYLYTTSTNLDLSRYKGLHIIVTGQEGMDERWKYTPVITIQKIQVLE